MANVFIIRTMNSCATFVYFLLNSPAYHRLIASDAKSAFILIFV